MIDLMDGARNFQVSKEEERRKVAEALSEMQRSFKEGDTFYILSARWWEEWCAYVSYGSSEDSKISGFGQIDDGKSDDGRPNAIDNSKIVAQYSGISESEDIELAPGLQENIDFIILPAVAWSLLKNWYGGGPAIKRRSILIGQSGDVSVELFPLKIFLKSLESDDVFVVFVSKKATVSQLIDKVKSKLSIGDQIFRLWDFFEGKRHKVLSDYEQTLDDAEIQMGNEILIESQTLDGKWPTESPSSGDPETPPGSPPDAPASLSELPLLLPAPPPAAIDLNAHPSASDKLLPNSPTASSQSGPATQSTWSMWGNPSDEVDGDVPEESFRAGLVGLGNLGNTCFMNSALQCLVHTEAIKGFFMKDYMAEINRVNPLGLKGELAEAFGELLRKLWTSQGSIAPRAFKSKLSKFAPQFSGYNQHDSQELLAFLLDGLHEDLNRVKNKPYIEAKDSDGRPDSEVADEYWANHKARNDSIIVDSCQGQYKSTLVCPICEKVSVTFDPFMYLSLPLPTPNDRTFTVTFISPKYSVKCLSLSVAISGTIAHLKNAIRKEIGIESSDEEVLVAEVYQGRIFRYYPDSQKLDSFKGDDKIVAYTLPVNHGQRVLLMHHKITNSSNVDKPLFSSFGTPILISVSEAPDFSASDFHASVRYALSPFLTKKQENQGEIDRDEMEEMDPREDIEESADESLVTANGGHTEGTDQISKNVGHDSEQLDGNGGVDDMDVKLGDSEVNLSKNDVDSFGLEAEPKEGLDDGEIKGGFGDGKESMEEKRIVFDSIGSQSDMDETKLGETDSKSAGSLNQNQANGTSGFDGSADDLELAADDVDSADDEAGEQLDEHLQNETSDAVEKEEPLYRIMILDAKGGAPYREIKPNDPEPVNVRENYTRVLQSAPIPVLLQWTAKGLDSCDFGPLDALPNFYKEFPSTRSSDKPLSLYQCLDCFIRAEPLGPHDMWYCPGCKKQVQAMKKLDLWRLPPVLVVHLKRFSFSSRSSFWSLYGHGQGSKLGTLVMFPLEGLDMGRYLGTAGEVTYDLYAVSNHYGGAGGGHYTAFCKVEENGDWFTFDDSHVSRMEGNGVQTSAAYVLFYKRREETMDEK